MNCDKIQIQLSEMIDGELAPELLDEVRSHLESCSECRKFYKKLKALDSNIDGFNIEAEDDYWDSMQSNIINKIEASEKSRIIRVKSKRSGTVYRFVAVAAAVAVVAFVSLYESKDLPETQALHKSKSDELNDQSQKISTSINGSSDYADQLDESVQSIKVEKEEKEEKEESGERDKSDIETGLDDKITADIKPPSKARFQDLEMTDADEAIVESSVSIVEPGVVEEVVVSESEPILQKVLIEEPVPAKKTIRSNAQALNSMTANSEMKFQSEIVLDAPQIESTTPAVKRSEKSAPRDYAQEDKDKFLSAIDVENPPVGLSRVEFDQMAFEDFSEDEMQLYHVLKQKVDNLNDLYGYLLAEEESRSDSQDPDLTIPDDSIGKVSIELAEAYHDLGMITPIESERKSLLDWIKKLLKFVDKNSVGRIRNLISDLESKESTDK